MRIVGKLLHYRTGKSLYDSIYHLYLCQADLRGYHITYHITYIHLDFPWYSDLFPMQIAINCPQKMWPCSARGSPCCHWAKAPYASRSSARPYPVGWDEIWRCGTSMNPLDEFGLQYVGKPTPWKWWTGHLFRLFLFFFSRQKVSLQRYLFCMEKPGENHDKMIYIHAQSLVFHCKDIISTHVNPTSISSVHCCLIRGLLQKGI